MSLPVLKSIRYFKTSWQVKEGLINWVKTNESLENRSFLRWMYALTAGFAESLFVDMNLAVPVALCNKYFCRAIKNPLICFSNQIVNKQSRLRNGSTTVSIIIDYSNDQQILFRRRAWDSIKFLHNKHHFEPHKLICF